MYVQADFQNWQVEVHNDTYVKGGKLSFQAACYAYVILRPQRPSPTTVSIRIQLTRRVNWVLPS